MCIWAQLVHFLYVKMKQKRIRNARISPTPYCKLLHSFVWSFSPSGNTKENGSRHSASSLRRQKRISETMLADYWSGMRMLELYLHSQRKEGGKDFLTKDAVNLVLKDKMPMCDEIKITLLITTIKKYQN